MSAISNVKKVTNVNWGGVGTVVVGIALFGAVLYGIRRLPDSAVTAPLKAGANAVS